MKTYVRYNTIILCSLLVLSTSIKLLAFNPNSGWYNEITGIYLSKTFKLKKMNFQQCAKYETGNYIILVDKNIFLDNLKQDIADSNYIQSIRASNDTLDVNKMNLKNRRNLEELLIKQIEKKEAIIINTEFHKNVYKIKRIKYNRQTVRTRRRGGIEYIDPKTKSVLFDVVLWIS